MQMVVAAYVGLGGGLSFQGIRLFGHGSEVLLQFFGDGGTGFVAFVFVSRWSTVA